MKIRDAWERQGLSTADAEILLSWLLQRDRTWVIAHAEDRLSIEEETAWSAIRERRASGEPVAYITGTQAFFGRQFFVSPSVLIPRPATEALVSATLEWIDRSSGNHLHASPESDIAIYGERWRQQPTSCIVDIGTGSGCIAVTVALERPDIRVLATDSSVEALAIAQRNAARYGLTDRLGFCIGSLLEPIAHLSGPFLLVSNPPYVPAAAAVSPDVLHEPKTAIFAGEQGLDVLLPLVRQARMHPACIGFIVECREDQVHALA